MLQEFLISNRQEIIRQCRQKSASRLRTTRMHAAIDHGVPMLLQQIADALRSEHQTSLREELHNEPAHTAISEAAALHGAELRERGNSIDDLVHDYGDLCQVVTGMALEKQIPVTVDEFRTLNRCLDNAIAGAAVAFGSTGQVLRNDQALSLHSRLDNYSAEHRRLVDIAMQSFSAIQRGEVGLNGATASLMLSTLGEMRTLSDRLLPEIRLASVRMMDTPVPPPA